ncbi:MAG: deoxyribose-phosphate aldolase, partial [Treponema sp.]|nr:deoxyribose-phosphate aldolase [Treponema sp.]
EFGFGLVICTVVGFPLGYVPAEVKVLETELAVKAGAGEIDMVIDQGDVKNGDFAAVEREIRAVRAACSGKVLKVIVETCNLTPEEKVRLCKVVGDSGADYIKTSTGFGSSGACLADIALFKEHLPPGVRIKAAGGIRSREDLEAFIRAGADRLGTSSAVKLLAGTADSGKAGQY